MSYIGWSWTCISEFKSLHSNVSLITASGKKDTHIFNDDNVILIEDDKFSLTKRKDIGLIIINSSGTNETSYDISSNTQQRLINKLLSIIDDNTKLYFVITEWIFTKDFVVF